jgi:hypothetical protein
MFNAPRSRFRPTSSAIRCFAQWNAALDGVILWLAANLSTKRLTLVDKFVDNFATWYAIIGERARCAHGIFSMEAAVSILETIKRYVPAYRYTPGR